MFRGKNDEIAGSVLRDLLASVPSSELAISGLSRRFHAIPIVFIRCRAYNCSTERGRGVYPTRRVWPNV